MYQAQWNISTSISHNVPGVVEHFNIHVTCKA
jgi:hypothetical protein